MRFVGQHIKQYRILERVQKNEGGVVYKALDTQEDVVRAVYLLKPALVHDRAFMEQYGHEARILAGLQHPHLLAVHAFYEEPPTPFLVMDYVEGSSLDTLLRQQGALPYKQVLPLFKQLLQGLSFAHREGVTHRNIKPSSILLANDGQVKLADFGLAKMQNSTDHTLSAKPMGALPYLSPEHVRSMAEVDHRSDLYAVGMVLYEALTGRTPFQEEATAAYVVMRAIVEKDVAPPTQYVPSLPEALAHLVMKALARDPDDRYQSADEMLTALESLEAAEPSSPLPEALAVPVRPSVDRRLKTWTVYAVMGLALALTVALAWWALRDIQVTPSSSSGVPLGRVKTVTIQPGIYERVLSSVNPSGREGVLLLKAKPYGLIAVEGRGQGADSLEVTVAAGRQQIAFTHPSYAAKQIAVEVGPGQRKEIICYFEGYVRVHATDKDGLPLPAALFVNEQGLGSQTPVDNHPLPPGVYMIEVFLENYLGGVTYIEVYPAMDDSLLAAPPIETLAFVLQKIEG